MATSNIKLFDENKGNMLSDSEFNISNQRLNGLQTGVASSQLQNKAMYQASLVAYAIAQIMLQNGLNANDTDAVSAFVANLSGTMLQKVHDIATTEEAQAGTATGKWMSPALVKAFFDYMEATTSEAQAGTNNTKWMSPALVKAAIDTLAAKAQNILSDETKALFGFGADAVPDSAFNKLAKFVFGGGLWAFEITTKLSDGSPAPYVPLNGLFTLSGSPANSGPNGVTYAFSADRNATVEISSYIGLVDKSVEIVADVSKEVTPVTITVEVDTEMKLIRTSGAYKVYRSLKFDICTVGGGASGRIGSGNAGGGGGWVTNTMGQTLACDSIDIIVGSGGANTPNNSNNPGGQTSVACNGSVVSSAEGASGMEGNGNGGYDSDGTRAGSDGQVHVFNDNSLPLPGGGGGAGAYYVYDRGAGGKDFGGIGGGQGSNSAPPGNGSGPGGGGGGNHSNKTGAGGAGGVYIRARRG